MVELTDDMRALLNEGAKTTYGRCTWFPTSKQREYRDAIEELFRLRLAFPDSDGNRTPLITDEGRAAIGAPTRGEVHQKEWAEVCGRLEWT